jgi:hypothetical protein
VLAVKHHTPIELVDTMRIELTTLCLQGSVAYPWYMRAQLFGPLGKIRTRVSLLRRQDSILLSYEEVVLVGRTRIELVSRCLRGRTLAN